MRDRYLTRVVLSLLLLTLTISAAGRYPFAGQKDAEGPQFAFWYEAWQENTWEKLQPANVIIGVPAKAVEDIHAHGGRALPYVTFYQSVLGREFLHDAADLEHVGFHTPKGFLPSAFGRNPKPFRRGDWWYLQYRRDDFSNGTSRRKKIWAKLAPVSMPEREVRKIAAELL